LPPPIASALKCAPKARGMVVAVAVRNVEVVEEVKRLLDLVLLAFEDLVESDL
jgi:hypothetical protein